MKNPELLTPRWEDYELIDSGDFEKLERFGEWVTVRPEPQAIWRKSLAESEWDKLATAVFRREERSEERGEWSMAKGMPGQWWVGYAYKSMKLRIRLGLTSFKHVGIFPEQAENWNFIYDECLRIADANGSPANVLNLFAYTGGATLAACGAGAAATHVDSVKQVVGWARENMEASGMDGVRWIVDDALKFARREVKRGKKYDGIILDPPAYGRGPDGEKWVLEQNLPELLELCAQLLAPKNSFLVLNLYSMGLSALLAKGVCEQIFGEPGSGGNITDKLSRCADPSRPAADNGAALDDPALPYGRARFGELYFSDSAGKALPLGVFYRLSR